MSSDNGSGSGSQKAAGGLGFSGALTLLFIALKLLGKISWSWWWVLSPLWISFAAAVLIVLTAIIILYVLD